MRRLVVGFLVASLVALPILAQEKASDEKGNDRNKQFQELKQDYSKAVKEAQEAYKAAKTSEERDAVLTKINKQFNPRILKLVKVDPKDNLSLSIIEWGMMAVPEIDSQVIDILAENWAKDAKIKRICLMMMVQQRKETEPLLKKVLEECPDKDAQGYACFALAKSASNESEKGDQKATARAEKYYERIMKDFADVKTPQGPLGDQAKGALFEIQHLSIGKKAPNVESQDLDGKKVQLSDYKGKVVVLDIWATWCPPCKAMIPHEREMVKKNKDKPFALISISADGEKKTLTEFLETTKMPWAHWWNGEKGGILKDWNVQFFPTIYVIDSEGVIRYKNIRNDELEKAVDKLLEETKKKS